ncbi:hypothetical protein PENANT_c013G03696 [Penicillium antarcticum]|uniref:Uncharacterized protein n=1 Tax=Penicillium antarcticum TaxID=416450 RepID=A0A1V6Q562_9EURO|nr:uncharacterized protein N7508_004250 [Penicillium antarcticum]KAJ5308871.1 hypothetical protein N7508_004250 [Penicillium antarcticum]OQD84385.1 hypothetical protein PENANT_c013G03696 [Penicillium antarcticum]
MWSILSALLALPLLAVISIPLILSAWVTISFALFALVLRLSVVSIELVCGIFLHFLSVPTSSTSSLLTFAASEPTTPADGRSRRNSGYGAQPHKNNNSLSSWTISTSLEDPENRRRNSYARSMIEAHNLSPSTSFGFPVCGDEGRDFEGVGGWRSYMPSKARSTHSLYEKGASKAASSASSSATQSRSGEGDPDADIDADERAWLSLNNRLELPSQLVTLGFTGYSATTLNSPTHFDDSSNGRYHFRTFSPDGNSHSPQFDGHHNAPRNHHRSLTTSSLTTSDRRTGTGLSLALLTRPDTTASHSREYGYGMSSSTPRLSAPSMTPQPYSPFNTQSRNLSRGLPTNAAPYTSSYLSSSVDGGHSFGSNSSGGGGGGYFSLRRPSSPGNHTLSPSASGYTTPGVGISTDERDASLGFARLMAHYPTSPRHRRQSASGSNSRILGPG